MAILINLSPGDVNFVWNSKIYRVKEVMQSGEDIMIIGEITKPEPDSLIEPLIEDKII